MQEAMLRAGTKSHILRLSRCLMGRHGANNTAYEFTKHACTKIAGRNVAEVAEQIRHERSELNDVCEQLTVGEWILFHGKDVHGNEDPD